MLCLPRPRAWTLGFLATLLGASSPAAQWTCDGDQNETFAAQPENESWPLLGLRTDGGIYLGWQVWKPSGLNVRLQRFDPGGTPLWGPDGILVSDHPDTTGSHWELRVASSGGVVITLSDMRDDTSREIYAYRFDTQGNPLWGPDGIRLSTTSNVDWWPCLAELSGGDFVAVWSSDPGNPTIPGTIRMQRITPAGQTQFPTNGLEIATSAPITAPQRPCVLALETDSVIVAWSSGLDAPVGIFAQRFSGQSGLSEWNFPVPILDDPTSNALNGPALIAGPAGSIWVALNENAAQNQIGPTAQRLTSGGQEIFAHDGIQVGFDSSSGAIPDVIYDPATGSVMLFWVGSVGSDFVVRGQRVAPDGTLEWQSGGSLLGTPTAAFKDSLTCELVDGGALVGWVESTAQGMRVVAQRVSSGGVPLFGATGIELSPAAGLKFGLCAVARDNGQTVFAWEDTRSGSTDIFGQLVDGSGGLGGPLTGNTCVAKLDDLGCLPQMIWSGAPSLAVGAPFVLGAQNVAGQRNGLLVYGPGQAEIPFAGGALCATPPLKKLALQNAGGALSTTCSGTFTLDFQSWLQSGQDPQITPGTTLAAQWWYRAPGVPGGFGLTDGIVFYLCP